MPSSNKLIAQVEEALAQPKALDRDLVSYLVELTKALEVALIDVCRMNIELRTMDKNVASAANNVKEAIDALNRSYTQPVQASEQDVEAMVENQIKRAHTVLDAEKQASS